MKRGSELPQEQDLLPVLQQCNDLLSLQQQLCSKLHHQVLAHRSNVTHSNYQALFRELQDEKIEHAKTCSTLAAEREKLQFAEREVEIVKKQLDREKATFEKAFGLLRSKALASSTKAEDLVTRSTALEALCVQKDEEIAAKDKVIQELQQKLKELELAHKQRLQELTIKTQQEIYIAKKQAENQLKRRHKQESRPC